MHTWVLLLLMTQGFTGDAYSARTLATIEGYRNQQLCEFAGKVWKLQAPRRASPDYICLPGPK